jgi:hypothetical protein
MRISGKNINETLSKFYQGNSTLEEERFLREYFANQNIPEEFRVERELFLAYENNFSDDMGIDFDSELTSAIARADATKVIDIKKRNRYLIVYAAAASIAILLSLGLFFNQMKGDYVFSDTFDDPYIAMQETQRVLSLFGSKMQIAKSELENLEKLNTPIRAMESLTDMTQKLEYLYWIEFLSNPIQYKDSNGIIYEVDN